MEALVSTIICLAPAIALAVAVVILEERKMSNLTRERTVTAECSRCGATYQQPQSSWAVHNVTGKQAGGFDGQRWYGDGSVWQEGEYTLVWLNVYNIGGPYDVCDECLVASARARERAREYESPCAPRWFDPSYAGERWDDDY
jgi:hypothetical protein